MALLALEAAQGCGEPVRKLACGQEIPLTTPFWFTLIPDTHHMCPLPSSPICNGSVPHLSDEKLRPVVTTSMRNFILKGCYISTLLPWGKMKKQKATVTQQQRKPGWRHLISISSLPQLVEILTFGLKEHRFLQIFSVNQPQHLIKVLMLLSKFLLTQKQVVWGVGEGAARGACKRGDLLWWNESVLARESQTTPPADRGIKIKKELLPIKKGGRKTKLRSGARSCLQRQTRSTWGILSVADLPAGVCLGLIGFFNNDLWKIFKPEASWVMYPKRAWK